MTSNRPSKFWQYVTIGLLSLPLVVYLVATVFVRYIADDFCDITNIHNLGIFGFANQYYKTWTGQWVYAFAVSVTKIPPVSVVAFVTLLGWIVALVGVTRRWNIVYGLALLLVTLVCLPNIIQSVYWQDSMLQNAVEVALFCVEAWLLVALPENGWTWALCAGIAIIAAGLSNLGGVAQVIVFAVLLLILPSRRKRIAIMLISAIIGFIIVVGSPGTAARRSFFPPPNLQLSIIYGARATGYPVANAIKNSPLAFLILLLIGLLGAPKRSLMDEEKPQIRLHMLIVLMGIILLNFVCELASYYATSDPLPDRTQIIPIFLTFAGLMMVAYLGGLLLEWQSQIVIVVCAGLLTAFSVVSALNTASTLSSFAVDWDRRDRAMRNGGEVTAVNVPAGMWDIEDPGMRSCIITYYQQVAAK